MTGVVDESLEFCFTSIAKDTKAEGAKLILKRIPLVARCLECGRETKIERYNFTCPHCGSFAHGNYIGTRASSRIIGGGLNGYSCNARYSWQK